MEPGRPLFMGSQRLGHEFEQEPVVHDGQGSLACCSTWGHKELDTTQQLSTRVEGTEIGKQERDKAAALTSLKSGSFITGAREMRVTPEPRFWGQDCLLHFPLCILDKVASSLSQPQLPQF